jgi:leucyl/phenylalanyl-tRNA--protein transferase
VTTTNVIQVGASKGAALTPAILLDAYRQGLFPMAGPTPDIIDWHIAEPRAVVRLNDVHVPKSLRKAARKKPYAVTIDRAFDGVFDACAGLGGAAKRMGSWMTLDIRRVFRDLARSGIAKSVECWSGENLVAGLYGLAIGDVFFGESMFTTVSDGSKIALLHLIARLRAGGFSLLDSQMETDHMARFGLDHIPHADFVIKLGAALTGRACWNVCQADVDVALEKILRSGDLAASNPVSGGRASFGPSLMPPVAQ